MENKRHLNQVESLRAFAAIAVAIFHFSAYFHWNETTTTNFTYGALGVEIFYMISGFIIPYSLYHSCYLIGHYFRYMGKRLIRLLPPYWLTIFLILTVGFCLCKFLWGCPWSISMNFKQATANAFFVSDFIYFLSELSFFKGSINAENLGWINPIFATLEVELQFYILIGLLFPLFKKIPWTYLVVCSLLLYGGYETIEYDTVLVRSPYFICGMSIFFIKEKGPKLIYIIPVLAALVVENEFYYGEDLVVTILGILLLYLLPRSFKFLNLTGRISYSYYLIHGLAGGNFLHFTSESKFAVNNPVLMIIFALLISWIAAFIMYWFVERRSMSISKRIKYKKSK